MDDIFKRMQRKAVYIGDICEVKIGLKTALDRIFILNEREIEVLQLNKQEKSLFKPFFKNSDIEKYNLETKAQKYVLYLHEEIKNIYDYPKIWQYLLEHKDAIQSRKDANLRGAFKRGNWWVLSTPRLEIDFESPKIVTPYRTYRSSFALSDHTWYASADVYFITPKDSQYSLRYLLGFLNSKLYFLWLYHKGKRKGDVLELYQRPLSEIPVSAVTSFNKATHDHMVEMVDRMLCLHKQKAEATGDEARRLSWEIEALDREIDALVYELYSLTPEEIAIVEDSVNQ